MAPAKSALHDVFGSARQPAFGNLMAASPIRGAVSASGWRNFEAERWTAASQALGQMINTLNCLRWSEGAERDRVHFRTPFRRPPPKNCTTVQLPPEPCTPDPPQPSIPSPRARLLLTLLLRRSFGLCCHPFSLNPPFPTLFTQLATSPRRLLTPPSTPPQPAQFLSPARNRKHV